MLIKKRDSKEAEIKELTSLLSLPLPENKRFLIERELRLVKSGDKGENDSAYFIDFEFASSKRWAVIHDLRLECRNRVAQIDHLLINHCFDVYVLESKNFSYGVKITGAGEFLVSYNNKYFSIESPIEQNKRHIIVLESVFQQYDIMPKRLGMTIKPNFISYIMVSPKSRVVSPSKDRFDATMVIKADMLRTTIDKNVEKMNALSVFATASKISSFETLKGAAQRLAKLHKPIKVDYRKRFEIEDKQIASQFSEVRQSKKFFCFKCKTTITPKVATFCWDNKKRFGGKAYCFDCQKNFLK
ncbi:MAG: nuclease-related domain-containing protein [Thermodesulfovibrionales bacterium]|nr:nuclease-related domain-containing protein [Thermodesulfovibrionales bacterium]